MDLSVSDAERDFLLNILEQRRRDLLNEIAHTDSREFRQGLRGDEELLDSLVCRLQGTVMEKPSR